MMDLENDDTDADYVPDKDELQQDNKQGRRYSIVWRHYERVDQFNAICNYCSNLLSYRTTVTNLKKHLRHKHPGALDETIEEKHTVEKKNTVLSPQNRTDRTRTERQSRLRNQQKRKRVWQYIDVEVPSNNTYDTADTSIKFSSEIWRHFEHDEEEAKCNICKESLGNSIEDMKNHLEEHHTSLLDEIIAKAQKGLDADSDDDNVQEDDNDIYTEVVYLEDESRSKNKQSPKKLKKPRLSDTIKRKVKRERKLSVSSDEYFEAKSKISPVQDDLEMFINYIRCLLKKVPKDASQKLHLDIINLIMNAQTNNQPQQNIVIETVMENPSNAVNVLDKSILVTPNGSNNAPNNHRVITVPIQNLMSQINQQKFVAMPQLISVSSSNVSDANSISSSIKTSSLSMPMVTSDACSPSTSNISNK